MKRLHVACVVALAACAGAPSPTPTIVTAEARETQVTRTDDSTILVSIAPRASVRDVFAPRVFPWTTELDCVPAGGAIVGIALGPRLPYAQPVTFRWESDPPRELQGSASCDLAVWGALEATHRIASLQLLSAGGPTRVVIATMVEDVSDPLRVVPVELRPSRPVTASMDEVLGEAREGETQVVFLAPRGNRAAFDRLATLGSAVVDDVGDAELERQALETSLSEALAACAVDSTHRWPRAYVRALPTGAPHFLGWNPPRDPRDLAAMECMARSLVGSLPAHPLALHLGGPPSVEPWWSYRTPEEPGSAWSRATLGEVAPGNLIVELVADGDSVEAWTRLVTYTVDRNIDEHQFEAAIRRLVNETDPCRRHRVLRRRGADVTLEAAFGCIEQTEHTLLRFYHAENTMVGVLYAERPNPIPRARRRAWITRLQQLRVEHPGRVFSDPLREL